MHFTASGDFSHSDDATAVLSQIASIDPELHLALGDLSYGKVGEEKSWCDLVTSRVGAEFPFQLISGNHESNGQNGNIDDFAACLPNRVPGVVGQYAHEYFFDVPQENPLVRFVMISPGLTYPDGLWSYAAGTDRYQWTESAIDGARSAGVPWVVVGMHKPCLTNGEYACDPGADIMNLLVAKRVDLVLTGHEHMYARAKQLAHSASCPAIVPSEYLEACVADSDANLVKGAGTVFTIVGTGGVPLREIDTDDAEGPYFVASSGLNAAPSFGNLELTATTDTVKAEFRPTEGGTFTDSFTISGSDAPAADAAPLTDQPDVLASDSFARTVANGFGTAQVGGTWTTTKTASAYSVDGAGRVLLPDPGSTRSALLDTISSTATDLRFTVSVDKAAAGSGTYLSVIGRRVAGVGAYQANVVFRPSGEASLSLVRVDKSGGGEVVVQPAFVVPNLSVAAGDVLSVRMQVTGTQPTTLRAKVWKAGTTEPATWQREAVDATSGLQKAGALGINLYVSNSSTSTPVVVTLDDLSAVTPE
ncbi:MAG TPA: metallophosphoesterase [Glaciibacter sp.]|nr:metallophosphoesterase [Glaciibacter sp.]